MSEAEWVRQLWVAHADAIYRFAYRRLPDLADDVTSETFLTAWRRRDQVPDDARPWLFVTARNIVMTRSRSEERYNALLSRAASDRETETPEADVAEHVTDRVAQQYAWLSLSPAEREVLTLIAWDGLSNTEAAAVLECSTRTFNVRLFRARRNLKRALLQGTQLATGTTANTSPGVKGVTHVP